MALPIIVTTHLNRLKVMEKYLVIVESPNWCRDDWANRSIERAIANNTKTLRRVRFSIDTWRNFGRVFSWELDKPIEVKGKLDAIVWLKRNAIIGPNVHHALGVIERMAVEIPGFFTMERYRYSESILGVTWNLNDLAAIAVVINCNSGWFELADSCLNSDSYWTPLLRWGSLESRLCET